MTTPMSVYAAIAGRYGVDAANPIEVDEFFLKLVPALPASERESILNELFAASCYAPIGDVPPIERPSVIPLLPLEKTAGTEEHTAASLPNTLRPRAITSVHERGQGFDYAYHQYYSSLVRFYVRSFQFSREDAEELAQEAFLSFYKEMDKYRGETEWALFEHVARRVAYNRIRSHNTVSRKPTAFDIDDPAAAAMYPDEPDYADREQQVLRKKRLYDAIAELPDGQRQCLQLWLDDFNYHEIANVLRISIDAVKSRLHDARVQLRARLGEEIADGE